jgi:hypothetical protein
MKNSTKWAILAGVTLAAVTVLFFIPPLAQSPEYHQFADNQAIWGIPNFWNVVTNLPFLGVGFWGLVLLRRRWSEGGFTGWKESVPYAALVAGVFLTGLGSAYYHWAPNNDTLIWDRLPMTIIFMSLVSVILSQRVGLLAGFRSLIPLLLLGAGSVLYWSWTESLGRGDLRPYAFIQFYPPLFIVLVLYFFRKAYFPVQNLVWAFLFYGFAKFFELNDGNIHGMLDFIGGHPLKHLLAAVSAGWLISIIYPVDPATNQAEPRTKITKTLFRMAGVILTPFLVLTVGVVLGHYLFPYSDVWGWIILILALVSFIPFLMPPFRLRNVLLVLSLVPCFSVALIFYWLYFACYVFGDCM